MRNIMLKVKYFIGLLLLINFLCVINMILKNNHLHNVQPFSSQNNCKCHVNSPRMKYFHQNFKNQIRVNLTSSMCSEDSTKRGDGQKVISFSMFGKHNKTQIYIKYLIRNIKAIRKYYGSEYVIRVYYDNNARRENMYLQNLPEAEHKNGILCDLLCVEPSLDLCNVNYMRGKFLFNHKTIVFICVTTKCNLMPLVQYQICHFLVEKICLAAIKNESTLAIDVLCPMEGD